MAGQNTKAMKKLKKLEKLILFSVVLLAALLTSAVTSAFAQMETATGVNIDRNIDLLRRDLRTEKKKLIAMNVQFTEAEATKFWPVYDEYTNEMAKNNDEFYGIIREYVTNQKTVTDDQAKTWIKKWTDAQAKIVSTRLKYVGMIEKIIPPKKAALFAQIDRRLWALLDVQVSSEFPLITQ